MRHLRFLREQNEDFFLITNMCERKLGIVNKLPVGTPVGKSVGTQWGPDDKDDGR